MNTEFTEEIRNYNKIIKSSPHIENDLQIFYNYHSNKIEGNLLTLGETRVVLNDKFGVLKPLKDINEI